MNASERGGPDWWLVVQTMPWKEADVCLRDYRAALLQENPPGSSGYAVAAVKVQRVNDEIHRVSQAMNNASWTKVIRNVLPLDLQDAVFNEKRRLEMEKDPT